MKNDNYYSKMLIEVMCCYLTFIIGCSPPNSNPNIQSYSVPLDSLQKKLSSSQIINGEPVSLNDPISLSTVALYLTDSSSETSKSDSVKILCTGTLITKNIVLTAAHCIKDYSELTFKIPLKEFQDHLRVGFGVPVVKNESDLNVSFIKVKRILIHPEYKIDMVQEALTVPMPDLSLLLLESDVPSKFTPATLGFDPQLIQAGISITLSGYGLTSVSPVASSQQLMKVDVIISTPHLTSAQFSYKAINGKTACLGDSGGPAYITNSMGELILIGVTSWGDGRCSQVGVYTSVPAFADYISESIVILNSYY